MSSQLIGCLSSGLGDDLFDTLSAAGVAGHYVPGRALLSQRSASGPSDSDPAWVVPDELVVAGALRANGSVMSLRGAIWASAGSPLGADRLKNALRAGDLRPYDPL